MPAAAKSRKRHKGVPKSARLRRPTAQRCPYPAASAAQRCPGRSLDHPACAEWTESASGSQEVRRTAQRCPGPAGRLFVPLVGTPLCRRSPAPDALWDSGIGVCPTRTAQRCPGGVSRLMAGVDPPRIPKTAQRCPGCCLILAWVSCLRVGIWLDAQKPIKVLAHGRKAVSLIRAGVERFRHALRWGLDELPDLLPRLGLE